MKNLRIFLTSDILLGVKFGVIIGGNFVSWYGGFDSYMVASVFQPEEKRFNSVHR